MNNLNIQSHPLIISEIHLDYTESFSTKRRIVDMILDADLDIINKANLLERLLSGLSSAADCACSCACSCSCSCSCMPNNLAVNPQTGRVV